ncbi:hypothetical protein [Aquicoccus sp. SU-CL01552]|uniref:hypothetical protein n=1 Tax=Aquicoccus sp. SU-CL01552 TaxID=3127656 RepID=UPI0031029B0A
MKTPSFRDGQIKSCMQDDHSTPAVREAGDGHAAMAIDDNGYAELQAIESVSILGKHNGLMDDDLLDMLTETAVD